MHVQSFCDVLFQALLLPIMNPWESINKHACLGYQVVQNGPLTSQKWIDNPINGRKLIGLFHPEISGAKSYFTLQGAPLVVIRVVISYNHNRWTYKWVIRDITLLLIRVYNPTYNY